MTQFERSVSTAVILSTPRPAMATLTEPVPKNPSMKVSRFPAIAQILSDSHSRS